MNRIYALGKFEEGPCEPSKFLEIVRSSRECVESLRDYPLDRILGILDQTGKRWREREYPPRRKIAEFLGQEGMSGPSVQRCLDVVPQILDMHSLRKRIEMSLPFPVATMDGPLRVASFPGRIRALSRGVVVHVCAGNVFLGALDSLIMGMVTKNVNILKASSQDPLSLLHFMESLKEEDRDGILSSSISVLQWSRDDKDMEEVALNHADVIMVWGGEGAIAQYRKNAAPSVSVIGYGPKISFGVITRNGFNERYFGEIARKCAHDICLYDQKACASPQNIFVESDDIHKIRNFMHQLGIAMENEMDQYPPTRMDAHELAEIVKHREVMKFNASQGSDIFFGSEESDGYTLVFSHEKGLSFSPLYRFVYLRSYLGSPDLCEQIGPMRQFLQTAGVYAEKEQWPALEKELTALGVTRITEMGAMLDVHDGSPHDGELPLLRLLKWVDSETGTRHGRSQAFVRSFLKDVYDRSPFYHEFWKDVDWHGEDLWPQIPLLDKETLYRNTPPDSDAIFTRPVGSSIVFSSGGSTGRPKYSYFTSAEFDLIAQTLADQYRICGLSQGDTVANLFVSGHLWSSFLAVDRALNKIGVTNLPIGGQLDQAEIAGYLLAFRPNVLFGLPSTLTSLLDYCLEKGIALRISRIFYAGEHLPPSMGNRFRKHWEVSSIHSAGYASADAGMIGYQCPCQKGGEHHLISDHVAMELISPEGKIIHGAQEEGEIVVSALYRKFMPIVRYRSGDLGVYIDKPCDCGRADPVFRLIGRCDDRLQIGGSRIFVQEIDTLLKKHEFLTGIYQFVPRYEECREVLDVSIECVPGAKWTADFESRFAQEFLEVFKDLSLCIAQGWIAAPNIFFVPEGSIPRVPRTGKVKKIEDRRNLP